MATGQHRVEHHRQIGLSLPQSFDHTGDCLRIGCAADNANLDRSDDDARIDQHLSLRAQHIRLDRMHRLHMLVVLHRQRGGVVVVQVTLEDGRVLDDQFAVFGDLPVQALDRRAGGAQCRRGFEAPGAVLRL